MRVGLLRERIVAALATGLHRPEPEVVALTADRTKAIANYEKYLTIGGPFDAGAREGLTRLEWTPK